MGVIPVSYLGIDLSILTDEKEKKPSSECPAQQRTTTQRRARQHHLPMYRARSISLPALVCLLMSHGWSRRRTGMMKRYLNFPCQSALRHRRPKRSPGRNWNMSLLIRRSMPGWGFSRHYLASSVRFGMQTQERTTGKPSLPRDAEGSSFGGRTRHSRFILTTCKPIRSLSRAPRPRL